MIVETVRPEEMTHSEYKEKVCAWAYFRDFDSFIFLRRSFAATAKSINENELRVYRWQIECSKEDWTMFSLTWSPKIVEE